MGQQPQADGERSPDRDEIVALHAMLIDWRDALVNVSQALHDLHCAADPEGQQQARDSVDQLLKKLVGS